MIGRILGPLSFGDRLLKAAQAALDNHGISRVSLKAQGNVGSSLNHFLCFLKAVCYLQH